MRTSKRIISILLVSIMALSLTGCSLFQKEEKTNLDVRPTIEDIRESGDYVLTSNTGEIKLFNKSNEEIDSLKLKNNKKSDFIYTVDNGTVYASEVINTAAEGQIIYALDRGNNRVYMISVKKDNLKEIDSKTVKDSNIDSIYAYNGTFFYSVISERRSANKFTYKKIKSEEYNGVINYNATLPEPLPSKNKTYIVTINFIDEYLKEMNYNRLSSYSRSNMSIGPDSKTETYQIPCEVNSWTADGENIYFFYNERMGQYNMENNQIGLYYGPQYTFDAGVQDGLDGSIYTISNFGDSSRKGLMFELNQGNMDVKNIIEIENPNGMKIAVDRTGYICLLVKNNGDKYFTTLKIHKQDTLKEVASIPLSYVPTQLEAHNGRAYLLNEKENYFIIVDLQTGYILEQEKIIGKTNFNGVIPVNSLKIDRYLYSANGHYMNADGIEMLRDGTLVNKNGERVNRYMQQVNIHGHAINEKGELIDRYNNVIDENGNIIRYVLGKDGFYRNSKGVYVNAVGTPLVQNEEGEWIDPDIEIDEPITGHYDENGNFIIDADYLERHPNAYEKLEQSQQK